MTGVAHVGHLARRFATSLSRKPPDATDERWAASSLTDPECVLWNVMSDADRRHSVLVARRFTMSCPDATRDAVAAALLHDVGKLRSGLGTWSRVVATIVGPRTRRFRLYHDHELLGAEMLRAIGSSAITVSLVDGTSTDSATRAALQAADEI